MTKLHPIFEQALAPFLKPVATRNGPLVCDRCDSDEYLCNVYDGETICDNCCEKAYERQQEKLMEDGPPDTTRENQHLRDADRGHLVRR
jgi:hypothetical protein